MTKMGALPLYDKKKKKKKKKKKSKIVSSGTIGPI